MRRCGPVVAGIVLTCGAFVTGCTSSAPAAHLAVRLPATAALGAPLGLTVTGARSGRVVTLTATATDTAGKHWRSRATFRADGRGEVDVARDAPTSGSYTGVHDTGLVWSMSAGLPTGSPFYLGVEPLAMSVTVTASQPGAASASAHQQRDYGRTGDRTVALTKGRDGIVGTYVAPPVSSGVRRPAVLEFGGSEGGGQPLMAAEFAAAGYPALDLEYFDGPGLPTGLADIPLEYFATALRWLARQPGVDPDRLVIQGVSRGSEAALLVAVHFPTLVHAAVAFVPSSVVNVGYPDNDKPAWTLGGRAFSHAPPEHFAEPDPSDTAGAIPVARIAGPVLLSCGTNDGIWNSCAFVRAIETGRGHEPTTALAETGAGHLVGFPWVDEPEASGGDFGGTVQPDALGRNAVWAAELHFLAALDR